LDTELKIRRIMTVPAEYDAFDIVGTESLERELNLVRDGRVIAFLPTRCARASWFLICCDGYRCQRQKERLIVSIIVIAVALPKTAAKNMSS
jgi:hypothetical protein